MARACGGLERVQPFELRVGEQDLVSQGVLLDASDAAGAGDRGDVVPAGEDPRECRVCRCRPDLRADRTDLVDEREVAAEVLMDIAADNGLTLFTYAAEPGSRSQEALNLLGSWSATIESAEPERSTDQS